MLTYRAPNDKRFREGLPPETWCRDADGKAIEGRGHTLWSPEAPDSVFQKAGALAAEPLRKIQEKAPIAILLNGGEYALTVYGHARKVSCQRCEVIAKRVSDKRHQYGHRYQARSVKGCHDRCRCRSTDVGRRCDGNAMHINAKNLRSKKAESTMDENPDERTQ